MNIKIFFALLVISFLFTFGFGAYLYLGSTSISDNEYSQWDRLNSKLQEQVYVSTERVKKSPMQDESNTEVKVGNAVDPLASRQESSSQNTIAPASRTANDSSSENDVVPSSNNTNSSSQQNQVPPSVQNDEEVESSTVDESEQDSTVELSTELNDSVNLGPDTELESSDTPDDPVIVDDSDEPVEPVVPEPDTEPEPPEEIPESPVASHCHNLFRDNFVMGGYAGYLGSSSLNDVNGINPKKMKADGWNVDGPTYVVKNHYNQSYVQQLIEEQLCTVYTLRPKDFSIMHELFGGAGGQSDDGSSDASLRSQHLTIIENQVKEVLANKELNDLVSAWYILPEEIPTYQPNNVYMHKAQYDLIKSLDDKKRPIFTYVSRNNTVARVQGVQSHLDAYVMGGYIGYQWTRPEVLFVAKRLKEIQSHYSSNKFLYVALQMYQQYDPEGNFIASGQREFSPQVSVYMPSMIRHDVFASIANGVDGFFAFSFADRPGFKSYDEYYQAYQDQLQLINTHNLDRVFSDGRENSIAVNINSGRAEIEYKDPNGDDHVFPTISARSWIYGGKNYAVLTNSYAASDHIVSATVTGLSGGTYVDIISQEQISVTGNGATINFGNHQVRILVQQ